MKLTWYISEGAFQGFLESFAPLLFAAIGLTFNLRYVDGTKTGDGFVEYLGNILAIALTVVFILPTLSSKRRTREGLEMNHIVILCFFTGLILSPFANYKTEEPIFPNFVMKPFFWSLFFIWFALLIPAFHIVFYIYKRYLIDTSVSGDRRPAPFLTWCRLQFETSCLGILGVEPPPIVPNGHCFLGRPADESDADVPYDDLARFFSEEPRDIHISGEGGYFINDYITFKGEKRHLGAPYRHFRWIPSRSTSFVYGTTSDELSEWTITPLRKRWTRYLIDKFFLLHRTTPVVGRARVLPTSTTS